MELKEIIPEDQLRGNWHWEKWEGGYALCDESGSRLMGLLEDHKRDFPGERIERLIRFAPNSADWLEAVLEAGELTPELKAAGETLRNYLHAAILLVRTKPGF